jgi:hypothetical protein
LEFLKIFGFLVVSTKLGASNLLGNNQFLLNERRGLYEKQIAVSF